jgi:hypothetical protein
LPARAAGWAQRSGVAVGLQQPDDSIPAGTIGPSAVLEHDGGLRAAAAVSGGGSGPGGSDLADRNQHSRNGQDDGDQHDPNPRETNTLDKVHRGLPFLLVRESSAWKERVRVCGIPSRHPGVLARARGCTGRGRARRVLPVPGLSDRLGTSARDWEVRLLSQSVGRGSRELASRGVRLARDTGALTSFPLRSPTTRACSFSLESSPPPPRSSTRPMRSRRQRAMHNPCAYALSSRPCAATRPWHGG